MTPPEVFVIAKAGYRYERSGDSLAVYDEHTGRWIARFDLPAATEAAFLKAVEHLSAEMREVA